MGDNNSNINSKDFMIGTLIGGMVGAAVALLFAPKTGKELRSDINQGANEWKDAAYVKGSELKNMAYDKGYDLKNKAYEKGSEIKDKAIDKTSQLSKNVSDKTQELTETAKSKLEEKRSKT